ncbi:MAG: Stk1 family PASTA domain-containing Ser/Thr kinase [Streptomycetaceae bacterium]|nr:Stk1 family PASTA domain-containing Ser/Thr kinase [Streptomycetaceae bacterium]
MEEPRRLGGRYELGMVLGRGGMAEVYLAHDIRLGRTVAVKTLRADLARDPSFQARFRREAQSAASLNHPAIVAVYDTGEDYVDGVSIPYIVMEYVDGSTLRELLHSGRKLLPERSLEMTVGILQALEYSHRNGIVHRDIKPANVMLTRTGQVKVMDFGIARAMGDSGMTMTQTAAVIGTAQYLSPEQAKGETVDARSDLYSTGCLLYELLTVRPPFVGDSPVAVAYQHVREEPQPPSVYDPEVTPEMDAIVLKALTKDPDYRYQSADEMRADVEAYLDGQPVAATAAMGAVGYGYGNSSYEAPTTALPRHQDAGHTSVLPPMTDGPDDGYGYEERRDRRRPNQSKGRTSTILLVLAAMLVLIGAVFIGKSIFSGGANNQLTAPNLVGQSLQDAETLAQNANLKAVQGGETYCSQDKGLVCSQTPAADSPVNAGQTITVTLSKGAAPVSVPSVVGEQQDTATQTLTSAGFQVNVKQDDGSSGQPAGQVLKQDPAGGGQAQKNATVTITVATAPSQVTIIDVTNKPVDQATQILQGQGLKVQTQPQPSATVPANTVISQNPTGGTQVSPGSTVTLTVSKGGGTNTLPDVRGKSLSDAEQTLTPYGLNWTISGPSDPNAVVVNTNPQPGSPITQGQSVTLQTTNNPNGGNGNGNGGLFG